MAIGVFAGFILSSICYFTVTVAAAPTPTEEVRSSQSSIYDTATKAQNDLRQAIDQLEYIKASAHNNASKLGLNKE